MSEYVSTVGAEAPTAKAYEHMKCRTCLGTSEVYTDSGFGTCPDCHGTRRQKFYHGSTARLRIGDVLLPGRDIGKSNFPTMDNSWGVWMSLTPDLAAKYGDHIYEVEPLDFVTDWCAENGWDRDETNDEYVTGSARILAVVR